MRTTLTSPQRAMNRWRRPAVVTVVLVCTAGLVTGCGGADAEPAVSAVDSSSPAVARRRNPHGGSWQSATPAPSHADCLSAERRAARNIWLWQAVTEVTSAPTGYSAKARDSVAKRTANVEGQLLEKCGGRVPPAFTRFSSDVQPALAANRFGNPQLDQVLAAWLRWGSAVGVPESAQREIQNLESCRREFFPLFDASYRVGSKGTETGQGLVGRHRLRQPDREGARREHGGNGHGDQDARGPVRLGGRPQAWAGQEGDAELGRILSRDAPASAGQHHDECSAGYR